MTIYQIRLQGHLDHRWEALFAGFKISHEIDAGGRAVTLLTGPVADPAALYGLFARMRDLGAVLISVQPCGAG